MLLFFRSFEWIANFIRLWLLIIIIMIGKTSHIFWIFVYCLNFLNYYMLNVSFLLCLSCIKPVSWIFALIFLRVFPFLEIFQINRHWFNVILIFRIRKSMNFFLHLLIFKILLFFLLQCISLAILNYIFLRF